MCQKALHALHDYLLASQVLVAQLKEQVARKDLNVGSNPTKERGFHALSGALR